MNNHGKKRDQTLCIKVIYKQKWGKLLNVK